ncbi:MAG: DUF2480 family protein [Bacteroidota bacterium]|jgi:hypothetical protein
MSEETIINKVEQSGLITINLEEFYPEGQRKVIDIREQLIEDVLLREKSFREYIASTDWSQYQDCFVAVYCSVDAVIPHWAYMLVATALQPFAKMVYFGNAEALENKLFEQVIDAMNVHTYQDARVIIKGCSDKPVPAAAYFYLAAKLRPVAKSIMFGEPCSTVPVFKKK